MATKQKDPRRVNAGKRSNRKGGGNERVIAKLFKEWWGEGEWARTPRSGGWATHSVREGFRTCGDIITTAENFPFCVEAKHQVGWNLLQLLTAPKSLLFKFWEQAVGQTPSGLIPLLVVNKNHRERVVITWESVFEDTVLESTHLTLCQSQVGDPLVILLLSDFFKLEPTFFHRSIHGEARSSAKADSEVSDVQTDCSTLSV